MQMTFHDRAPLEKVRRLADGRIAAVAKFARSGCYTYSGSEVGRPTLPASRSIAPKAKYSTRPRWPASRTRPSPLAIRPVA